MVNMAAIKTTSSAAPVKFLPEKQTKKPRVKPVLNTPFNLEWPIVAEGAETSVISTLLHCCGGKMQREQCKPEWNQLRKISKSERKKAIQEHRNKVWDKLSSEEKELCTMKVNESKERWSHVLLGYNNIMRSLEKDKVAALLVEKNVTPEFLAMSFLPVCTAKDVPLVPIPDLKNLVKNEQCLAFKSSSCIAIAFKQSIKGPQCCFNPLYQEMVKVLNNSTEEYFDDETVDLERSHIKTGEQLDKLCDQPTVTKLLSQPKKMLAPFVDVTKYHLKRTRTDIRVFTPGKGINKLAQVDEADVISVKDEPQLNLKNGTLLPSFSFRHKKIRRFQIDREHSPKQQASGMDPRKAQKTHSLMSDNLDEAKSDLFFELDVCAEEPEAAASPLHKHNKNKGLKRKLEKESVYVTATIRKIVPRPNK